LKNLIPPFSFQMNFEADQTAFPLRFRADLAALRSTETALRLLFKASTDISERQIAVDNLTPEIDSCHGFILAEFEAFFTDAAKAAFVPYDTDAADPRT
jgi:hypothetical protein